MRAISTPAPSHLGATTVCVAGCREVCRGEVTDVRSYVSKTSCEWRVDVGVGVGVNDMLVLMVMLMLMVMWMSVVVLELMLVLMVM